MAWDPVKDSHGSLQRPLDTIESFFKVLNDSGAPVNRAHWAISTALRIHFPPSVLDPVPFIRQAWLLLRKEHPNLGAVAVPAEDAAAPGSASSASSLSGATMIRIAPLDPSEWLAATFFLDEASVDADALLPHLRPPVSRTATCHWLTQSSELIIHSAHWRIDGVGMMLLAGDFLDTLAAVLTHGLSYDVADGAPTPSLDTIVGGYTSEETIPQRAIRIVDAMVGRFLEGVPSIGLPTTLGSEAAPPSASGRVSLQLRRDQTAAVVAACKVRGLSVAAAVHASIVRAAAARYEQHPLARHYAAFFATDLRRYLPQPWRGREAAVGLFLSGLPVCVKDVADKSWEEIAREIQAVYRADLSRWDAGDGGEPVNLLPLVAPYVRRTIALFTEPVPDGMPPLQSPDCSSLGVVEKYVGREYAFGEGGHNKFEVQGFWMTTEMLPRVLQYHVWTFRELLTIAASFNHSFYDKEFVTKALDEVKDELLTGLGIK